MFHKGFSQDIKKKKELSTTSIKKNILTPNIKKTLPSKEKNTLLQKKIDTSLFDSIKPKETLKDIIIHDAKDYTIQNAKDKTLTLYNEAVLIYGEIDLKAGIIIVDYNKETLFAKGIIDSTGYTQRPLFKQ